jgi:hypothetical protein
MLDTNNLVYNKDLKSVITDITIQKGSGTVTTTISFGDFSGVIFEQEAHKDIFNSVTVVRGQSGNYANEWAYEFFEHFQSDSPTAVTRMKVLVSNYINPKKTV